MSDLFDLIVRMDAIDALYGVTTPYGCTAEEVLRKLPSVEPKKGKWIPHCEMSREYFGTVLVNVEYEYWFCDACGYRVEKGRPMYNFCPNCGARMEAKDE